MGESHPLTHPDAIILLPGKVAFHGQILQRLAVQPHHPAGFQVHLAVYLFPLLPKDVPPPQDLPGPGIAQPAHRPQDLLPGPLAGLQLGLQPAAGLVQPLHRQGQPPAGPFPAGRRRIPS